jgi:hypothetical protein
VSSPDQIELVFGDYRVAVENASWGEDPTGYGIVYHLEGNRCRPSSWHRVKVFDEIAELKTCLLTSGGGASGVHPHSAVCVGPRCYVAVGDSVCALSVPELDLLWATLVDSATCFGVYHVPGHGCLISHGELEIARVDFAGRVVWQTSGRDIFSEGIAIHGDFIDATDWDKTTYRIDIETGQIVEELPPAQGV